MCSSGGPHLIFRSRTLDEAVAVDKAGGVQMPSAVQKQDYLTCKDVWMIDERSAKQRELTDCGFLGKDCTVNSVSLPLSPSDFGTPSLCV